MIKVDDDRTTIHLTRGDATHDNYNQLAIVFPIWDAVNEEESLYEFKLTDSLNFVVYEKKGYTRKEIFNVERTIAQLGYLNPTTSPKLQLRTIDTNLFELENKPQTYYYEVILNDDTTIIGCDEDGDKKIIVYPGGTMED